MTKQQFTQDEKVTDLKRLFGDILTDYATSLTAHDILARSLLTGDKIDFHGTGFQHNAVGYITAGNVTGFDVMNAAGVKLMHVAGTFDAATLQAHVIEAGHGLTAHLVNDLHGHHVTVEPALTHLAHASDFIL